MCACRVSSRAGSASSPRAGRAAPGVVVVAVLAVLSGGAWFGVTAPAAPAAAAASGGPAPGVDVASLEKVSGVDVAGSARAGSRTADADSATALAQGGDSGPKLDPQTEADQENAKNKLIVGLAAAALLGIIVWGRIIRRKRANKDD